MRRIQRLFWRQDWVEHILERHEVTPEEVEEALFGDSRGLLLKVGPAERDPEETAYRYLGRTAAGRYLLVALIYMGQGEALVLTARDMDSAERRRYSR
jgi:uncharacterized DUF497 family protein